MVVRNKKIPRGIKVPKTPLRPASLLKSNIPLLFIGITISVLVLLVKKERNDAGDVFSHALESPIGSFGGFSPANDDSEEQLSGLQLCTTKPVAYREEQSIAGLKATELLKKFDHSSPPLNPHFVFQNKMQHSGTRTIDALYKKLAYFNEFNYVPIDNPMTIINFIKISVFSLYFKF